MMENEEIEILEPKEDWEKDMAVYTPIVSAQVPVQKIIINGQEQVILGEACALICPKCRTILQQFQPGVTEVEILKSIDTEDEKLLHNTLHCRNCGQKLKVFRELPIEVQAD